MRAFLCLSSSLKPTCSAKARFDIWSTHPYTSGGPTHHAYLHDDVSLGDLGKMRSVLDAAVRAGHISGGRPGFWVTEFSWDSAPPDPSGVPQSLLRRCGAGGALHDVGERGQSRHLVRYQDEPLTTSSYQSCGSYTRGSRARPAGRSRSSKGSAFRSSPYPVTTACTSGAGRLRVWLVWSRSSRGRAPPGGDWARFARQPAGSSSGRSARPPARAVFALCSPQPGEEPALLADIRFRRRVLQPVRLDDAPRVGLKTNRGRGGASTVRSRFDPPQRRSSSTA